MNLPGFSAEASLSRTINGYYFQPSAAGRSTGRGVVASRDDMETFNCGRVLNCEGRMEKEAEFVRNGAATLFLVRTVSSNPAPARQNERASARFFSPKCA